MKKIDKNEKTLNELIIDEAVKQFKDGSIKNSMELENFGSVTFFVGFIIFAYSYQLTLRRNIHRLGIHTIVFLKFLFYY